MISQELARFLESGISINIATRDAGLEPHGTRAWAAIVEGDGAHVTAFVQASDAPFLLADLEANGAVALVFSRPADHRSVQVKGVFAGARAATEADRAVVSAQAETFLESLVAVGIPRVLTRNWRFWPSVGVRLRTRELFTQTPGPGAGEPLA